MFPSRFHKVGAGAYTSHGKGESTEGDARRNSKKLSFYVHLGGAAPKMRSASLGRAGSWGIMLSFVSPVRPLQGQLAERECSREAKEAGSSMRDLPGSSSLCQAIQVRKRGAKPFCCTHSANSVGSGAQAGLRSGPASSTLDQRSPNARIEDRGDLALYPPLHFQLASASPHLCTSSRNLGNALHPATTLCPGIQGSSIQHG